MKPLLTLLFVALAAFGQTATLTLTGPATVRPGQQITLSLGEVATGGNPAGVQWAITLPGSGWTASATAGAATTAVSKTLFCNSVGTFCLIVGLNPNTIANGPVAQYVVSVPANATTGTAQIPLSNLLSGNADGIFIPATSGPTYSVTVLALTDLNGDGKTDILDLQLLIPQIVGTSACSNDLNGDSKCDLLDALILIRAALGI